jgi:hypothetical protein
MKLALLILLGFSCPLNAKEEVATWHGSMRKMAVSMTELIPELSRPEVFLSSEDKAKTIKKSKAFLGYVHKIKENTAPPTQDPIVSMMSGDLKNQIEAAIRKMEVGNWSRGAQQMLAVSNHCIGCHTLTQGPATAIIKEKLDGFSHIQKANFYAATRQFDRAVVNYEYALADKKWATDHENEWVETFKRLLAITVRTRNSPNLTLELISRFFDTKVYSESLKPTVLVWRQHSKEWATERENKKERLDLNGVRALIEKADSLQIKNKGPVSFLLYLRASSLLHSLLSKPADSKNQEVLLLSGQIAEVLAEQNFWVYSEHYYRRCVELDPKSKFGITCSERLGGP